MRPDTRIKGSIRIHGEPDAERTALHLSECEPCRTWLSGLQARATIAARRSQPWIGTIGEWAAAVAILAVGWFLAMAASIILQD